MVDDGHHQSKAKQALPFWIFVDKRKVIIQEKMGGCQSNSTSDNKNGSSDGSKVQIEILYCGGNTVKPYFEELRDYLESRPTFKDRISIRGRQDLMFSGRFEIIMYASDGNTELIHSKKNNQEHGWARKPEERRSIVDKIQEELNKRDQASSAT